MKKTLNYIGKFFLGLLLLMVSILLLTILLPWGIIEMFISLFWKKRFWKGLGALGEFILLFAVIVDVTGNVVLQVPLNRICNNGGYKFGSRFDTISYVLGHGLVHHTLTKTGVFICKVLDKIDPNHCSKTYYNRQKIT